MLGWLGDLLGLNSGDPAISAGWENKTTLGGYDTRGNAIIDAGAAQAGGHLQQVTDMYSPLAKLATGAGNLYGDALGINGADGSARAKSAFTTNPGYDFARDEGLKAVERRRSAGGSWDSGGTDIDTMTYATGLADQSYGSWLDRLANPGSIISGAIPGMAGALNNQGNLATGTATQKLGVTSDVVNGFLGATNQMAEGESANKAGVAGLGKNLMSMAGKAMGWGGF